MKTISYPTHLEFGGKGVGLAIETKRPQIQTHAVLLITLIGVISGIALNAVAEENNCSFCNNFVILNAKRAQCFLTVYDDRTARLQEAGRGFVELNLDICEKGSQLRKKDPYVALRPRPEDTSLIYLDSKSLICLFNYIKNIPSFKYFEPEKKIYIQEICK